ncbi:mucin-17-like isoform X2 [Metopolophium dirhodum]|uniref:mucin-17-like isoform X2 n=1 Tax=Metopolophium dirhodum TaxID=44670 RepID=UPI002990677C|nr:mucin-17-like isoform X2 [Metopolophium dirhodum]
MQLDMALGSAAPTSFQHRCGVTAALILVVCVSLTKSAPTTYDEIEAKRTDLADYFNDPNGCYYNYQHYEEGDRIVTNEPCLNCTCHNRMLMCYLRVCPFSKAIGQDCTVQKSPDQCCPTISCPEVPVHLLTSSTTPTPTTTTEIGWHDNYGCMMDENEFFPDGAQVPPNPKKPCELCYCIRNRTACIMQECTLHVEGCRPVYHEGVCCPVRYDCDYESEKSTTSTPQITGGLVFSTTSAPFDCRVNEETYRDGESIAMVSEKPCEHCYCMRGDIVCAVQDCGEPLRGKDCTPETPPAGQCCPTSYQCANETNSSYDTSTLQPMSLSDSDENEAEKFPLNEDVYNKLGENQPSSEQDDGNDVESDDTTAASPANHNAAGETNILPNSDGANKLNEANKQETASAAPNLINQENSVGTESGQANFDSTDKPDEPTSIDETRPIKLPSSDPSSNENDIPSTTQTVSNKNDDVKVDQENNSNEIPDNDSIQDGITSNLPVASTENSVESGTQSYNVQDKPQEDITTENIAAFEKEPITSNDNEQTPEKQSDTKPQTETASNENENPPKIENQDSAHSEIVSPTEIPKVVNEPTEQNKPITDSTLGAENQPESDKTPLEQINQDSPQLENVSPTDVPKVENDPTEQNNPVVDSTSGAENQPESDNTVVEQNNPDSPQSENASPTEIPKVVNEPTEQNKPAVDSSTSAENQPQSEKTPAEQINQDSPQLENVSPTDVPKVENEPTEQNKPIEDSTSGNEYQPESDKTPAEKINQDSPQSENVSPTEIPKVVNEPTEHNKPVVDGTSGGQNQPETDKTSEEQINQDSPQLENISPTDVPKVENKPTEQNKPAVDSTSGASNQPESDNTAVEQNNQDGPQSENLSSTEIPKVVNEANEQNKPVVDSSSGAENQPESDNTTVEQNNPDSPQSENSSPTEIPKVINEPTEQNKPSVDSSTSSENQQESNKTPAEQINQDGPQSENVSPTDVPKVENEPTEQNKPSVDSSTSAENQQESDKISAEQINQDSPQSENVSPTDVPKVENVPTEQNTPVVDNTSGASNQPESDNTVVEQNNPDSPQSENLSPTEIPKVVNEPTEQNKPVVDSSMGTENQPESDNTAVEQNNPDSPQSENLSPTEIPKVVNEPTEQIKPAVDSTSGAENQSESDNTAVEQNNPDSPQSENSSPTEIPKVVNEPTEQNKPAVDSSTSAENQPETDKTPAEQINQDSPQSENVSPTDIPKVENVPTEQNTPVVDNTSGASNQPESDNTAVEQNNPDSSQSENSSPTEIPKEVNEPTEQNKPAVDSSTSAENQQESDKTPAEQINQDSPQSESVSPTEIPKVVNEPTEQNKPVVDSSTSAENQQESDKTSAEQINQDSPQSENVSPTDVPKVENVPTEQNTPVVDNTSGASNQPESDNTAVEQNNPDSPQSENLSPTEIPKVVNEPTEQNKPVVDSSMGTENQPESDKIPVEQINQDSLETENVSPTEIPKVVNEPTEQNKPVMDSTSGQQNPSESDKTTVEQINLDSPQSENVSPTDVPKVENEPIEQNKPAVDSTSGGQNQPESDKTPVEQNNQGSPQSENTYSTEIPSKPYNKQPENIVPENSHIQPDSPVASENDAATEQPNEDNNIFIVSPTSPPLFSDNQVKGEEPTSISNENNTSDKYSSTEKNEDKTVEVLNPSADDKLSFTDTTDKANILPASHTETVTEGQNLVPQVNDENNENAINIKPVDNKVNSDIVTESPVNSNENVPVVAEHNDNKLGSNNPVSLEPAVTPITGINYDVNTEVINHDVSANDPSSHENQPVDEQSGEEDESPPNADSVDHQITLQTETPTELDASTNKYLSSADEHANDVTTYSPQLQIADNNIPVQPQAINPSEPITTQDETKTPNDLSSNGSPDQSSNSYVPTEINGVQNSEAPTESPVLYDSNGEQSISTQAPAQNNEYENVTPHEQSQDENVNEIVDQTAVYPDSPSDDKNNLVTSTAPNLNNVDNVTPSSDKIEIGLNSQISDEKPIKDTIGDVSVGSATIQTISGSEDNADNLMTTNSYADVVPSTDTPTSHIVENGSPVNPSNVVETNVNNDRPENVVPQLSSNEASTQYSAGDESTNSPIQESPNMNIINDVEASTNVPYKLEGPNEINQDSNTESELYATQSPTENNILNANPIVDGKPSESPQNADKPFVSKTPDYVIDITTSGYSESSNVPESIITNEPVDSVNEVTTSNVDKNSDVVTEQYENVQPGVPGEGSCLIDFVTYAHKAEVPKSNPCHEKCECLNSIVTCTSVNCPPAPPQHRNCIPLHPGNESWCCPTYMCEGGIEGMLFDSHNQLGSPQLISTVVLEDKPGEVNDEKTHSDEDISSTSNPQTSQEYNTLAPSQLDLNSNINSEDSVGVTEVSANTEVPYKPIEDVVSTDGESDAPVTAVNLETIDNTKPVSSDPSLENEKPADSDKPEENNKPTVSDQLTENNKPTEINQAIENQKPIENSEADSTTTFYVTDDQSITNKPETINNIEEQNLLVNTVNESQDQVPSTQVPENYEPSVTNVIPASDQNQPEQNSESDVSISVTTYKPSGSVLDQQQVDTDNKASEGVNNPPINEDSNQKPANEVMDLPVNEVNPVEVGTQMPTVVADEKPMVSDNNVGGLRPTSIDDIISSVYLVKDAVKNSLETSSKPTETLDQQPGLFEDDNQPTIVPDNTPQYQYDNESPTTTSSVNGAPESQQTDAVNEISPEIPTATTESNISPSSENVADGVAGATQIPNILPQSEVNSADQEVSTDLPSNRPGVETVVDDNKTPLESPTTQRLPSSGEQDLTNDNGPETPSDPILPHGQNAAEPNTNSPTPELPVVVDDNKTPENSSPSSEQHEVHVDDTAVVDKPVAEGKPDDVNSQNTPDSDVPAEVPSQVAVTGRPEASTPDNNDNRFSDPSSSSFRPPVQGGNVNNHYNGHPRPETSGAVHIPLDTETPAFNPSTNAPLATYPKKPSYTPIPQSTWTQKPFHQESTSEATLQPDQGFPDEYEDENEASYGSGTCRYGGKIYVSAQQVPRDDPCDFCFCFRGDIICLQQSCPPPIFGCYQENIQGFCCPRYECPVAQATSVNVTTSTTSTTTVVPPHFFANAYRGAARRTGCLIHGHAYRVGEDVGIASGPCLECICGADGKMKCDPKPCSPEPLLRKMMAEAIDQKRR